MAEHKNRDIIEFPNTSDLRLSEDQMALEFTEAECHRRRYVALWNKWMRYGDGIWDPDETYETFDAIRPVVRARANSVLRDGKSVARAMKLSSAATVAGVEKLARSDRRVAATSDQWDTDPMVLGVPGGVINLLTGKMRPATPEDYLTRRASVLPDPEMPMPVWDKFLTFITEGDEEYIAFLQRMCGYCLTGSTVEQVLFFVYGDGGNGKSVFVEVLARILSHYHQVAAMETFIDTGRTSHPTDLAMLRASRLVTAQETEQGRRWNESRIKQLTGGDQITARFMRQDFFTYTPQFKLVISGNHKPSLKSVDQAMRRRMRLLPFVRKVPDDEIDLQLLDKLLAEAPGIFAWMIRGCLSWQREGLGSCAKVDAATTDYLREEDAIGNWISDCCVLSSGEFESSAKLFESWKCYAEAANEHAGNKKTFGQALLKRGFLSSRKGQARGFLGITVKSGAPHG